EVGPDRACGIKSGGFVVCWGKNINGDNTTPPGAYLDLAIDGWTTCGLRSDGSIDCWGLGLGYDVTTPEGPFNSLESGNFCALRSDGTVSCIYDGSPQGKFASIA